MHVPILQSRSNHVAPDAFVRDRSLRFSGRTNASAAPCSIPLLEQDTLGHLPDSLPWRDNVKMASAFLDERWLPKSVLCLSNYDRHKFLLDLIAGITVGLVALPLAMAFSIASGLTPQAGIYCAIVTGFLISALGGSKTQIGGPTGAFVVVIAGIVAVHGVDGLFMCTVMAGVLLVIMGVTGMGTAVKFIPRPVVIGFTNGIAVLIASTQVKDFFGLQLDKVAGRLLAAHRSAGAIAFTRYRSQPPPWLASRCSS